MPGSSNSHHVCVAPNPTDIPDPGTDGVPVGSISMWSTATAPANWLLCDGSAVSRITYSHLFSVIGTTWGAGDATTTFNIPDIGNRLARGTKSGTLAPNAKAGAELTSVTLVAANLPQHRHGFSSPGLLNVTSSGSQQVLQGAFNAGQVLTNVDQTYAENGSTPVVSLPFNVATTNPYVAIPYIVKYAQ